jgi:FkbM family methyltransferase
MFRFLIQCLRAFGVSGLIVYVKLKLGLTQSINLPEVKFPIAMRAGNTDRITFKEIFIKREYDFNFPSTIDTKVIIDAGANIGFTSVFLANQYPNSKIFSIEPDDENFEYVLRNTSPYKNITPIKKALWNKKETISLSDPGLGKRGMMVDKHAGATTLEAISVTDLMKEFNISQIDILKMDIEGSEKEVFTDNYDFWLPRTKCLVIELHDRMKKGCSASVFRALSNYDFSLSIKGENLIFINNLPISH